MDNGDWSLLRNSASDSHCDSQVRKAAQACEFDFAKSFRQCLLPNLGILAHTKRIRRKLASFEFKCKMHEMLTYCAHQAQCEEPEGTLHMKEDA